MKNLVGKFQFRITNRLAGTVILVGLGLMLQGALVFPLLRNADANSHSSKEAEQHCLQMGRRTRILQELHISRPRFDAVRLKLITKKLGQLEPKIQIADNDTTRQQLLAALRGTDCLLLDQLWRDYSVSANPTEVKSQGEFYALFLKATAQSLDPFSDFEYFSKLDRIQVATRNPHQILGIIALERKDHLLVNRILPFTAAEKEGSIRAGDKIVAIQRDNGETVNYSKSSLAFFKQYLRSQPDVMLLVKRNEAKIGDRTLTITIKKDELSTRRAFFYVTSVAGRKVGVIKLPSFYINYAQLAAGKPYEGAAPDVLNILKALQKENVEIILLDLRGNLGGDKDEVLRILGYFLGKKIALKTRYDPSSEPKIYQTLAERVYDSAMGVLIDRLSASAAEILAGAIQDHKRGSILGENSYGKCITVVFKLNSIY
ncbi:PDZ domain-containing protein [Chroococcidiopsis sp. FACHB-1243]|uniref:S41 family peptidase n=1 Tax=Chroococcidiopsis sp. [FACHB-1243] TaxID=2692781 RepID=UPI001781E576|nr:S41 family peptidase [Chroococcidiopsis sp. [FACHB-1243]]MBD2309475.1 PDZ domain-containing protein [Chroococcidiopsis sp. [FACHB-1243]]